MHVAHAFSGYSVGWATLSLINAGLAQGKGRSGLVWWLISLVLGPLATLLLVLQPRVETPAVQLLTKFAAEAAAAAEQAAAAEDTPRGGH